MVYTRFALKELYFLKRHIKVSIINGAFSVKGLNYIFE